MKDGLNWGQGGVCQVACNLGGIRVYSHSLMNSAGLTVAMIVGNAFAAWTGMAPVTFLFVTIILAFVGFMGARLLHVLFYLPQYLAEPRRVWYRGEGGMAMQGGLLLAFVASVPLLSACHLAFSAFWDIVTIPALIWLIFGKVGCFLHGCCSGRSSTGALSFDLPDHHGTRYRRVPVQLLEAGLALLVVLSSAALWSTRPYPGMVFALALAAYSVGRFALQSLREPGQGNSVQKGLALLLLFLACFGLVSASATTPIPNLMEHLL